MKDNRIRGRSASPGYAAGRIHLLDVLPGARAQVDPDRGGDPAAAATPDKTMREPAMEASMLAKALAVAVGELGALIESLGAAGMRNDDAVGILGFQLALMQDEALVAPARQAIAAGRPAAEAWRSALNDQIRWYQTAEDEYFRARASDLGDVRDRVLDCLQRGSSEAGDPLADIPPGALLVAGDLAPSRFLAIEPHRLGAVLLLQGSPTSHVAMLARARGLPMVVGLEEGTRPVHDWQGMQATVDANRGEVVLDPGERALAEHAASLRREAAIDAAAERLRLKSARTADGLPIRICINLSELAELDEIDAASCDGIGLARTEFLFQNTAGLPDEEVQYLAYRRMVDWAGRGTVTIRTLDAGGDKPIPGLTIENELNPFLGMRGLRLSLAREEVFRVQLRALARAACHGDIRVMVPMVTMPHELAQVRRMLEEELAALARARVPAAMPRVGMMVEVPAAALMADTFDADFFSIGSNDLAQYVSAVGRDVGALADLASPTQPAMLRLIAEVVAAGNRRGIETSLCGDAASDPDEIAALLGTGLRTLSVAPAQLARVKLAVAGTRLAAGGA
jgi:phosphotransferase system enzyme I (PtsI)